MTKINFKNRAVSELFKYTMHEQVNYSVNIIIFIFKIKFTGGRKH
jgi:hypothetical protein